MKPLALTGIYIASGGLVTLAVEGYDYTPDLLIIWGLLGIGLAAVAIFRKVE